MKVDFFIQNKVSEQDFEAAIYEWLSQGDYTPDDIIENIITEHNLMYFPIHYYKSSYVGTATASLGYIRYESYYVYNPDTKRQEEKTRTVTDWRPHAQNVFGEVSATVYVGEAKFNFLRPFVESTYWSGHDLMQVEADTGRDYKLIGLFKQSITDAWNQLGVEECHRQASKKIVDSFPSTLVRNFNANLQFTVNSHASIVVPFWVFMYDYQGEPYYVAVDGNNPSRVRGLRPENKKRKNTVIAIRWIGWLGTIGLSYLAFSAYLENNPNEELSGAGLSLVVFICFGMIVEVIVSSIKNASKKRRQEKLAKMKALRAS